MRAHLQPKRQRIGEKPFTAATTSKFDFDGKRLNRLYQRNRAIADLKQSLSLLVIIATCVSVVYLLSRF